ncbi:Hypothetical protein SMAX5B_017215 [Scophthalmus maximus]|uniref:Uncharacterized protein n=1 Tax=Scophthalmus maximus TaxID=52904 RepID=A0A2U9AWS0_SCOMX|nr:Hypothetical protein SMAX5B_017215 [Scophthalmus maximus]
MAAPQRTTVAEAVGIGGRRNTQPTRCAAVPHPVEIQGHKSTDLLIETLFFFPSFITTRLRDSRQVIRLTNYRRAGSLRRVWAKVMTLPCEDGKPFFPIVL